MMLNITTGTILEVADGRSCIVLGTGTDGRIAVLWTERHEALTADRLMALGPQPRVPFFDMKTMLLKADSLPPGKGRWFRCPDGTVIAGCPKCSGAVNLVPSTVHRIGPDGDVLPSLAHDCGWHGYLALADYKP